MSKSLKKKTRIKHSYNKLNTMTRKYTKKMKGGENPKNPKKRGIFGRNRKYLFEQQLTKDQINSGDLGKIWINPLTQPGTNPVAQHTKKIEPLTSNELKPNRLYVSSQNAQENPLTYAELIFSGHPNPHENPSMNTTKKTNKKEYPETYPIPLVNKSDYDSPINNKTVINNNAHTIPGYVNNSTPNDKCTFNKFKIVFNNLSSKEYGREKFNILLKKYILHDKNIWNLLLAKYKSVTEPAKQELITINRKYIISEIDNIISHKKIIEYIKYNSLEKYEDYEKKDTCSQYFERDTSDKEKTIKHPHEIFITFLENELLQENA